MSFPFDSTTPRRSIRLAEKAWKENFFASTKRVMANYKAVREAGTPIENVRATLQFLDGLMSTDRIVLAHPATREKFRTLFDVLPQRYYVCHGDLIARACIGAKAIQEEEIRIQESMIRDYRIWRAQGLVA